MILAVGRFAVADILDAAVAMSAGRTADHDGPSDIHPDGWGAVWRSPNAPHGLAVHRDLRPIAQSALDSPLPRVETNLLAIHARYATLPGNLGLAFTHPLYRDGKIPWYFMHNGYLPNVHRNLGMPASEFDSREYFDWLIPFGSKQLDERSCIERLAAIEPGGSSGNAIAISPQAAYLIHWSPPEIAAPRYFTLQLFRTPEATVVASEIVPDLADRKSWSPVPAGRVLEFAPPR